MIGTFPAHSLGATAGAADLGVLPLNRSRDSIPLQARSTRSSPLTTHVSRFGILLRRYRLASGLSQEQLAAEAGLSARGIRALERGERTVPRLDTVRLLADALGLNEVQRGDFIRSARPENGEHGSSAESGPAPTPRDLVHIPTLRVPKPPSPLIGRDEEAALVIGLLRQPFVRLVTLTGPGGVGKTRLALAVAPDLRVEFADGAVFVDLGAVRLADLVPAAIARALKVPGHGHLSVSDAIADFLAPRSLLLVLDNCEHVLDGLVIAAQLLAASPRSKVLATSRERLNVRGERDIPIAPLAIPESIGDQRDAISAAHDPTQSPSVRLFLERAAEIGPQGALNIDAIPVVTEICRRLDGLPLALELAAARLRHLTPRELLERLEHRLPILSGGPRDLPDRQQTLRNTVDWSYQLLPLDERILFRRLAVFAGGWSASAALSIAGELDSECLEGPHLPSAVLSDPQTEAITRDLEKLVDKSLIFAQPDHDHVRRFAMLETIREFAFEALVATGEDSGARAHHAAHFRSLVEKANDMLKTAEADQWIALLDSEYDNILAALAWSAEHGDSSTHLGFVQSLGHYWYLRGNFSEAREWLARALGQDSDTPSVQRADALYAASMMARAQSDFSAALRLGEQALKISKESGDSLRTLQALYTLGGAAQFVGDHELAAERLEEGLRLARLRDEPHRIAAFLNLLGDVARAQQNDELARNLFAEALDIQRNLHDTEGAAWSLNNLGSIALDTGKFEQAQDYFEEALQLFGQLGIRAGSASVLCNLGATAIGQARSVNARTYLQESLTTFSNLDDPGGTACVLEEFARLFVLDGQYERAASLLGAVSALRDQTGEAPLPAVERKRQLTESALRSQLGVISFSVHWSEGRTTPMDRIMTSIRSVRSSTAE
jgi:predicted ATPase/transcriptional regulator with XRE-family HTH domain/Tfp pilus assembly protein PilF